MDDVKKLQITPKPPKGEDGNKIFGIRIKNEMFQKLEELAGKTGRSRNELITMFIQFGLQNYELSDRRG